MKPPKLIKRLNATCLAVALGVTFMVSTAMAIPYASNVSRSGNTVTFVLNQNAANVQVLRDGGNAVYPGTTAGTQTFDMSGYTTYEIRVTGVEKGGWTQYVADQTSTSFEYPYGVSINRNPASTNFGKVYVSQGRARITAFGRTCSDGIYMLMADGSDAGFATGGVSWTGDSSPYKTAIGPDDHLYVSDLANDLAYEFNDDMSVATQLIDGSNKSSAQYVGGIYVEGTQAAGNRKLYLVNTHSTDTARKGIIGYNLNGNATAATGDTGTQIIGPTYYKTSYYPYDVARDSHGDWYVDAYRANLNQMPPITKFNGAGTLPLDDAADVLWEADKTIYYYAYGLDIDEPNGRVAYGNVLDGTVWFFNMATGAFLESFDAGNAIRELAFDAAGNLVTVDNGTEWARFWSPGGTTTAITRSSGTFEVVVPPTRVSVAATTATANEAGPVNGVYTISRSGDVSGALTVAYTMSGTATSGSDYLTLPGSVTFVPGATSTTITLVPVDESVIEFTETAILSLTPTLDFTLGTSVATINIRDNETPEISISTLSQPILLEGVAVSKVTSRITRKGLLTALTVNLGYSGTATLASDFTGPTTVALTASDVNKSFTLARVDDGLVEGSETATVSLAAGTGYIVGTPGSTNVTIIDDEVMPGTALFSDKFDLSDTATNWVVNYPYEGANASAAFGYDYGVDGIPEAPSSVGTFATKRGLKMMVNQDTLYQSAVGLSASPTNGNFTGNYRLRFDMWLNYNGPLLAGGRGSSEWVTTGVGTQGSEVIYADGSSTAYAPATYSPDVVWFTVNGDGSSGDIWTGVNDCAAFASGTLLPVGSGVYAAGTDANARWSGNAYYSPWVGGIAAPTAQTTAYPTLQTGSTKVGTMGFAWHKVAVTKQGASVTWDIDGRRIATVDTSALSLSTNVFVGYNDQIISGSASNSFLRFLVVDNLKVESLTPPPAPTIVLDTPPSGANFTIPATINCAASVTDNGNIISKVQFYDGTTLLGEDATAPYAYAWTGASAGSHSVKARVLYNLSGTLDSAANSITVINPTPPSISGITAGTGDYTISGTGSAGQTFVLYAATSLLAPIAWTPIQTNSAGNGAFSFVVPQGANPTAFFKVAAQ